MIEKITNENSKEYERFVRSHPNGNFFQTLQWRRQKPNWKWRAVLRWNDQGVITGSMAVLIRRPSLLPWSFVYCCRGPVCDPADTETLLELLCEAKNIARQERAYRLRMDPLLEAGSCDTVFSNAGFRHRNSKHTLQPSRLWRIPIHPQMLSDLSSDHAQSIRMAVQRKVTIRQGGRELVPIFTELMHQAALRDNFVVRTDNYYAAMMENFGHQAQIFLAECEGRHVAAALVIQHGPHLTCLFECDDGDITLRAPYLLRSAILHHAEQLGCTDCEFSGLPSDPTSSDYQFAAGFGGMPVTYTGEWDWVRRPFINALASLAETIWNPIQKYLFFLKIR